MAEFDRSSVRACAAAKDLKGVCSIDVEEYVDSSNGAERLRVKELVHDIAVKVLTEARANAPDLFEGGFDIEERVLACFDAEGRPVCPVVSFSSASVAELMVSRGSDLALRVEKIFDKVAGGIVRIKDNPDPWKIAKVCADAGVVAVGSAGVTCLAEAAKAALSTVVRPPGAPVAFEAAAAAGAACTVLAAVCGAILLAASLVYAIARVCSMISRTLAGVIVNNTPYDLSLAEPAYMKYGVMSARYGYDGTAATAGVIPARPTNGIVNASMYVIEKNDTWYGAECTMKFKMDGVDAPFFFLSANPLSQDTRLAFIQRSDRAGGVIWSPPDVIHPKEVHDELYAWNKTEFEGVFDDIAVTARLNSDSGADAYLVLAFRHIMDCRIDFDSADQVERGGMRVNGSNGFVYDDRRACWRLDPGGHVCVNALASSVNHYEVTCRVEGDRPFEGERTCAKACECVPFDVSWNTFETMHCAAYCEPVPSADCRDLYELTSRSNVPLYIERIRSVPSFSRESNRSTWMSRLRNGMRLADVNMPASHDAASIQRYNMKTPWACHALSIADQLAFGMRVFDIRIKPRCVGEGFEFLTCHGSLGGGALTLNEYEPLISILDAMKAFLKRYESEIIVATLKIDDRGPGVESRWDEMLDALFSLVDRYAPYDRRKGEKRLGTVGELRGSIVLFNRITDDDRFGYSVGWTDKTAGEYASDAKGAKGKTRDFDVFVQDKWTGLGLKDGARHKSDLVKNTASRFVQGDDVVVFNYTSACSPYATEVFPQPYILEWLGTLVGQKRPKKLGWVFMDYEERAYPTDVYNNLDLPSMVIASNFDYEFLSSRFKIG